MERIFWNADGELLLVPEHGALRLETELGRLTIAPGEIAILPRGIRFRVILLNPTARGYIAENHGAPLRLRVERQLGYKHAKYVMRIELRDSLAGLYGGKGGYWEDAHDYQWYAGI